MNSKFLRICSMILTIVMVINLLPTQALEEMIFTEKQSISATDESLSADAAVTNPTVSAEIVEEIEENRTEYTKEFKLSNGLHMAVVYGDPVHYDNNGKWDEIDNTLIATTKGTFTNTAGVWDVSLPQQLNGSNPVTITKDGYTLSFVLAGELNKPSDAVVMSEQAELSVQGATVETEELAEPYAVASTQSARAQVVDLDYESYKAEAEYEETVIEKRQSRLLYANVYSATNITYDLDSNRVKESVILKQYNANLRGYKYTLNVGNMVPVLGEDGHIDFYNEDKTEIVMVMPAPFLIDADNVYNDDIQVQLVGKDSTYTLTYILPQSWLADEERQWPVVLDPIVQTESTVSNIIDQNVYSLGYADPGAGVLQCGYSSSVGRCRAFLRYDHLPELSPADVIVEAKIRLYKANNNSYNKCVEVHKVLETWNEGEFQWADQPAFDDKVEDYNICRLKGYCTWDVTDLAREWFEGNNTGMLFKLSYAVEDAHSPSYAQFWSADYSRFQIDEKPTLLVYFRNNNGLESYWDYTSASAGRAGTGYVNDYTGNLVWTRSDIGFGGNRAPVSISHVYNANDTAVSESSNNSMATSGNAFGMGFGWRTNYNQLVYQWSTDSNYYVWEDSDGTDHYFKYKEDKQAIVDEDDLELTLAITDDGYTITNKNGAVDYFDSQGRLWKQENNQATKSAVTISYIDETSKLIDYVTDGIGRKYDYTYENGMLTRISYLGSGTSEISYVAYTYDANNNLETVKDKDGKSSTYGYTQGGHLLTSAQDIDGYKLSYTYTQQVDGKPSRIATINESHNNKQGSSLTLTYGHNQTTFEDHNKNKQISQFNDFGNTVSMQDGLGRAQHYRFTFNTAADAAAAKEAGTTSAKSNQLALNSKMQNTVKNYLTDPSFENGAAWTGGEISTEYSYIGSKSLFVGQTVHGSSIALAPGETVTFSANVKTLNSAATLFLDLGATQVSGETLWENTEWERSEVSYTNTSDAVITAELVVAAMDRDGAYIDCVQLEKTPTASRYNLIDNGDFSNNLNSWTGSDFTLTTATSGAPQLDNNMVTVTGDPSATRQLTQTVNVSGAEGDTFVLAGWAKGDSVPLTGTRTFGIIGTFNYTDGTTGDFTASFNPDTNSTVAWQYTAEPMVAKKAYSSITVKIAYDYNANSVCFDGIQLFKETFGNSYTYDDDGNITSVVDLQKQQTTYEYTNNDLTAAILPSGAKLSYEYDDYHNVIKATSETGQTYTFEYDTFGNNTKVSILEAVEVTESEDMEAAAEEGTGSEETEEIKPTISSSAAYSADGNRLVSATDALGNVTTYSYNADTNMLEWVKYPNNTDATRTNYSYDSMYRQAAVTMALDANTTMSASYTYKNDLLKSITTPTTTYSFGYGDFALRENVKIGSRTLASYSYTDDQNKYLASLDYGNGDKLEYKYDKYGRLEKQTYEDGDNVSYQYDNDGALAAVTDSATGITTRYYYDFSGRDMGYSETGTNFNHTVGYEYDQINNLTTLVENINGVEKTTSYTYDKDNRTTSITTDGTTVDYTYDDYGRVTQQVTKNGDTVILTEVFTFKNPSETATSSQVETYKTYKGALSDGNLIAQYAYTYDNNGNILTVSDGSNTTRYTFDSANQLTREDNQQAGKTYTWTYDNAGNIKFHNTYDYAPNTATSELTSSKSVAYKYENDEWGDLLTEWNGIDITYDQIGNPTLIGDPATPDDPDNISFTWEHGRQLKTLTDGDITWTYTYSNAGLRTGRTDGHSTYSYIYDGSNLVQMSFDIGNTAGVMTFTYDANGTPLTVKLGEDTYYYVTNLQGDVTALVNAAGNTVVSYSYSAYGVVTITEGDNTLLAYVNPLTYRGYVYDTETRLFYLQSRYYNPQIGRFLNADSVVAGIGEELLGCNMFAYCFNNPISMDDSSGNWPKWSNLAKGASWLAIGVTAVCVGLSVLTCGVAAPAMMAVAAVTVGAGVLTAVNGAAEVGEAFTGYNVVRDTVFSGNQKAYDAYANTTAAVAEVGTAICGGWSAKNAPRIKAYKSMNTYNVKNKHLSSGTGSWSKFDTTSQIELRKLGKEIIKNTPMDAFTLNSPDSYKVIYDFGRVIGTGGETSARLVFSDIGKIITFFPN